MTKKTVKKKTASSAASKGYATASGRTSSKSLLKSLKLMLSDHDVARIAAAVGSILVPTIGSGPSAAKQGDTAKSTGEELRKLFKKKGGSVKKYAHGGRVRKTRHK